MALPAALLAFGAQAVASERGLLYLAQERQAGSRIVSDQMGETWAPRERIRGRAGGWVESALFTTGSRGTHELVARADAFGPSMQMTSFGFSLLLRGDGSVVSALRTEALAIGDLSGRTTQVPSRVEGVVAGPMTAEVRYMAIALVGCGRLVRFGTVDDDNRCEQKRVDVRRSYDGIVAAGRIDGTPADLVKLGWKVVGVGAEGAAFNVAMFNPALCNPPFARSEPRLPADELARRYIRDYVTPRMDGAMRGLSPDRRQQAARELQPYLTRLTDAIREYEQVNVTPEAFERVLEGEATRSYASHLPYFRRCVERLRASGLDDPVQLVTRAYQAMNEAGGASTGYNPVTEQMVRLWTYRIEVPLTDAQRAAMPDRPKTGSPSSWLDYLTDAGAPFNVSLPDYVTVRSGIIAEAAAR